jgi:DNA-binding NtrC family response regulator
VVEAPPPVETEPDPRAAEVQSQLRALLPPAPPVHKTHFMPAVSVPSNDVMTTTTPVDGAPAPAGGPIRRGSDPRFPRVLPDTGMNLFSAIDSYQNNLIKQALARTSGNRNRAAQLLGLNRTTLVEMIRRRGL